MRTLSSELEVSRAPTLRSRLSHRLAMHLPVAPVRLSLAAPLLSLSFDDVPESACTAGAALLESYGARGTYYVAGALIGQGTKLWRIADGARIAALHAAGHEIACHTHDHAFVPALGLEAIRDEVVRNRDRLCALLPDLRMTSFAYPFGYASLTAKRVLRDVYTTCRSIAPGVNHGRIDRQFLRANPLIDGQMDIAGATRLLDLTLARKGWLIFYGHDVSAHPSPFGCRPALLEAVLGAAADRGIACVTVAEGFRRAAGLHRDGMPVATR